jgi:hypothetical protein
LTKIHSLKPEESFNYEWKRTTFCPNMKFASFAKILHKGNAISKKVIDKSPTETFMSKKRMNFPHNHGKKARTR